MSSVPSFPPHANSSLCGSCQGVRRAAPPPNRSSTPRSCASSSASGKPSQRPTARSGRTLTTTSRSTGERQRPPRARSRSRPCASTGGAASDAATAGSPASGSPQSPPRAYCTADGGGHHCKDSPTITQRRTAETAASAAGLRCRPRVAPLCRSRLIADRRPAKLASESQRPLLKYSKKLQARWNSLQFPKVKDCALHRCARGHTSFRVLGCDVALHANII